ncbi:MAG: lysophospholipid acyltransferase family protein [Alistipes sp.]|nr:lysophospholipid acyltransferase family protein [Alistipes sp.]
MADKRDNKGELRLHQRIALELLWGICLLLSRTPEWLRFGLLQSFIRLVLRLLRYRRKVILKNLRCSFPEKNEAEIRSIMLAYYDTLAEVIVDTLCLAGATPERDGVLLEWENYQEHIEANRGRDWIAMASHYGFWEYYPLWSWLDKDALFMGVYHPLRSPVFEHLYRRLRNLAPNIHQVAMADTLRFYMRHRSKERTTVLGLISDQSPALRADTVWFDFLNQKTAFIEGSERLALKFSIPIYFVEAERLKPGRYRARFKQIYDGVEQVEPKEITRRYAEALEAMVRRQPELWMWSHNRWKHTPEKQREWYGASTDDAQAQ